MHGDVGAAVEHGLLDLLDEHALAADHVQRDVLAAVAGRLDEDELGRAPGGAAQRVGDGLGLGRACGLPRVARRTAWRHACVSARSNRSLTAAALRSPCGVPASSRRRTDGPCSSLATIARVSASTASRSVVVEVGEPAGEAGELAGPHRLGPLVQLGDERRRLAGQ